MQQRRDRLEKHNDMALAIEMITIGIRTPIVSLHTGISPEILRELHHSIHGRGAVAGQLPESTGIVAKRSDFVSASIFMNLYIIVGGPNVHRAIDIVSLMKAYKIYTSSIIDQSERAIDCTDAWVLARDLRSKIISMRLCECGAYHITFEEHRLEQRCPTCGKAERVQDPEDDLVKKYSGVAPFAEPVFNGTRGDGGRSPYHGGRPLSDDPISPY